VEFDKMSPYADATTDCEKSYKITINLVAACRNNTQDELEISILETADKLSALDNLGEFTFFKYAEANKYLHAVKTSQEILI
jgi:hypothetical protein